LSNSSSENKGGGGSSANGPLGAVPDLAALCELIISPSPRFEPQKRTVAAPSSVPLGVRALELFNELAPLVKRSLPISEAPKAASPTQSRAPQQQKAAPAAPAAPAVTTANADYRPALKDQSLVEALLQLHERTLDARGLKPPAKKR
jgi:hypothetical protein